MKLYHHHILDHYHNPRNKGFLSHPAGTVTVENAACGDSITMQVIFDGTTITQLAFEGKGCILSQAAASLLTEKYSGTGIETILALESTDILDLLAMELGPNRLQCVLLPLQALQELAQKRNHD